MTITMALFMSSGARLANIFAGIRGCLLRAERCAGCLLLYMLGIVMAVLTGLRLLKYTIMRGEAAPFCHGVAGLSCTHVKSLIIQTGSVWKGFVLRAGKVIIISQHFPERFQQLLAERENRR